MFWNKKIPEINYRLIGVGHRFFYSPEEHAQNPNLIDGNHYVKLDTSVDSYFAYLIQDKNEIIRFYRHSLGIYYSVDRRICEVGNKKRNGKQYQEDIRFLQIGDDWAFIIGKEHSLHDATIVDEAIYDMVIADEAQLKKLQDEWKRENN